VRETLYECITELPIKTPLFATLVGLLNPRRPEFVADLIHVAFQRLVNALSLGASQARCRRPPRRRGGAGAAAAAARPRDGPCAPEREAP